MGSAVRFLDGSNCNPVYRRRHDLALLLSVNGDCKSLQLILDVDRDGQVHHGLLVNTLYLYSFILRDDGQKV